NGSFIKIKDLLLEPKSELDLNKKLNSYKYLYQYNTLNKSSNFKILFFSFLLGNSNYLNYLKQIKFNSLNKDSQIIKPLNEIIKNKKVLELFEKGGNTKVSFNNKLV